MTQTQTKPNSVSFEPVDWLTLFADCEKHPPVPTVSLKTLAILNPPFGKQAIQHPVAQTYELGHHWRRPKANAEPDLHSAWQRTSRVKASTQLEVLFLELALRQIAPGEVMVALVPNGILADHDHSAARHWLMNQAQLWASIQLPKEVWQAECKTGIITSVIVFQKRQEPSTDDYNIFMAMIQHCGYNSRGKPIPESDFDEIAEGFRDFCPANQTSS
ncbi:type I restriction-modification system methyltransferase subunit (plasmid) [Leptolyngbya sp. BL0902]|uniref:N-6 DNA methylase n=1 Tax=Leptolyngbya sp. BL0902 TaxID=1115757 RepID=UPI0018E77227|nr:N-6 DNA methylase [Leptolyngbya sp. BL0902]QQE67346.1 type I restriction-modification system methyltransferase subunit [Leptolyngbya sp. BL0902]